MAIRNWQAFRKLGIRSVNAPGGYHTAFRLNQPVDIGDYKSPRDPSAPMLVHMLRTPAQPGLPEHEQHKAGRAELLATPFETFETQHSRPARPRARRPAASIRRATSPASPSIAGRTAMRRNTMRSATAAPTPTTPNLAAPQAVRPHRHRQFGCRHGGLYRHRHRPGPSRGGRAVGVKAFVVESDETFEDQTFEIFPLGPGGAGLAVHTADTSRHREQHHDYRRAQHDAGQDEPSRYEARIAGIFAEFQVHPIGMVAENIERRALAPGPGGGFSRAEGRSDWSKP